MTASRKAAHAAPQLTLYKPAAVNFARHRKPNRRPLAWHLDNLAATAVCNAGEWLMKHR